MQNFFFKMRISCIFTEKFIHLFYIHFLCVLGLSITKLFAPFTAILCTDAHWDRIAITIHFSFPHIIFMDLKKILLICTQIFFLDFLSSRQQFVPRLCWWKSGQNNCFVTLRASMIQLRKVISIWISHSVPALCQITILGESQSQIW